MTDLYIYRLRNQAELDASVEEVSAVYDKKKTQFLKCTISQPKNHTVVFTLG